MYANSTPYGVSMLTQKSIIIIDCLKYYFIALPQLFQLKLGRTDDCITWNVRQTLYTYKFLYNNILWVIYLAHV